MFRRLGVLSFRFRGLLVGVGGLLILGGALAMPSLLPRLGSGGYQNPKAQSAQVAAVLRQRFDSAEASLVIWMQGRHGERMDSPELAAAAQRVLARLAAAPGVSGIQSYDATHASQFLTADGKATFAVARLTLQGQQPDQVRALRRQSRDPVLEVQLGGEPAINADVLEQVGHDLELAESVTLPVVAVLLLFVFGGLIAALLPLLIGACAILGTFLLLRGLVALTPVSVFALNVVSMLGMGLAIDYSLFVISRFREELAAGRPVGQALIHTLATAGHTVFFSGLTVTLSLLSLLLFPQMLLRSMGLAGALGVGVAMGASLTVLPACLALLGPRINSLPVRLRRRPQGVIMENHGFWYRLSELVMRHPVPILLATLLPLLAAGSPFLKVRFGMPDERNVPAGVESRVVAEQMKAQFPANTLSPILVLLRFPQSPLATPSFDALDDYVQALKKVPGVQRVGSLVSLDPRMDSGGKEGYRRFYQAVRAGFAPAGKLALSHFASGPYSLVEVYFPGEAGDDSAKALVQRIRSLPTPPGAQIQVGGTTAQLVDLLADMRANLPRVVVVIVATIFVLLFLMLGSLVVPLKAVLLNFLSLTVTFGALVWTFQEGHLAHLIGAQKLGSIDALQPVLVFVIAFGLSMDYEVFLLSRIRESFLATGDNTRSVALGIQRTGSIINSAALVLAVVIVGFAAGRVLSLKQVGIGLLLAVLVDATVVRSLLVPATMRLLGRWNWWAPPPLRALHLALTRQTPGAR